MGSNNWDLDEIFAFKTPRFVRIRDRRLGILNLLFNVAIFAYIVVYLVIYQQGFKEKAETLGVARLTLQEPSDDLIPPEEDIQYCGNGTYKADAPKAIEAPQATCQYLDQYDAQFPRLQSSAIFLSTRISQELYLRNPSPECFNMTKRYCKYHQVSEQLFYVVEPEFFTFMIDHTATVPDFDWSSSGWNMEGRMLDNNGKEVDPCSAYHKRGKGCPDFINVGNSYVYDIIALQTLLEAAGAESLDSRGGDIGQIQNQTHRYAGVVFLLELRYDNYFTYDPSNIRYTYRVHVNRNTEYKVEQPLTHYFTNPDGERTVLNRHGIQVVVRQTGDIGRFNFAHLLIVLVTSLGLLALSNTMVNFLSFKLMPMRYIYRQYREVTTADFSELRDLPASQVNRFKTEDLLNPTPKVFSEQGKSELMAGGSAPESSRVNREGRKDSGASVPFYEDHDRMSFTENDALHGKPFEGYGSTKATRRLIDSPESKYLDEDNS